MNKLQIQSAIFNLRDAIKLAKFYYNKENILPEHRRRFEEIGENSRLILKYVEENKDYKTAKRVTSFERGWLYYLHDKEDNLSPMMVSIRECCHNLLRISNSLNAINEEEQISINIAELKSYFKRTFINTKVGDKEKGDKHETYFEMLVGDLQKKWTMKDYARFALIIYDSDKLIDCMKPNTFEEWYTTFCNIIGCKHSKHYKRCKLEDKDLENLKRNFGYL